MGVDDECQRLPRHAQLQGPPEDAVAPRHAVRPGVRRCVATLCSRDESSITCGSLQDVTQQLLSSLNPNWTCGMLRPGRNTLFSIKKQVNLASHVPATCPQLQQLPWCAARCSKGEVHVDPCAVCCAVPAQDDEHPPQPGGARNPKPFSLLSLDAAVFRTQGFRTQGLTNSIQRVHSESILDSLRIQPS